MNRRQHEAEDPVFADGIDRHRRDECGIKAASDSRGRYTVRFYIIAILFVIFDVETIFLFPWAVRYKALGWFGVAEVAVFLAILVVGYIWAYKKGALEWV